MARFGIAQLTLEKNAEEAPGLSQPAEGNPIGRLSPLDSLRSLGATFPRRKCWCGRRDSNPYGLSATSS